MADFKPFAGLSQEQTQELLLEAVYLLRRSVKLLEASGNADIANRQRIVVENTTAIPISGTVTTSLATINNLVAIDSLDRRQFHDQARAAYNTGIRANLNFN